MGGVRRSPAFRLAAALVTVVFLSGFINLVPLGSQLYAATVAIDVLVLALAGLAILQAVQRRGGIRFSLWMLAFVVLSLTYLALMLHGREPLFDKVLDFRSQVLYIVAGVAIAMVLTNRGEQQRLMDLVLRFAVFISAVGICQFLFRDVLPGWLLYSRDTVLFRYHGTDITRSTGLLGNTIVYANVLLLLLALQLSRLACCFSWSRLASAAVVFLAILTTFSRMAIAGAVVTAVCLMLPALFRALPQLSVSNPAKTIALTAVAPLVVLIAVLCVFTSRVWTRSIGESFLVRELFLMENASVRESTDTHNEFISIALDILAASPAVGAGLHSQSADSINAESSPVILDGAIWQILGEGGLLLFTAYALLVLLCLATMFKSWRSGSTNDGAALGLLVFSLYEFGFASVYNSAFFGKPSFILFWLVFGLVAAMHALSEPRLQHLRQKNARVPGEQWDSGIAAPGPRAFVRFDLDQRQQGR
ncbi:O-antigen ligase family protein [Arthrobacter sulfonylureivorans]|uniref:Uncharacterized protein n=1 Tax=Arthrobacter sulfonylureivorans TaxID=2486855 RepID=A0ABY3WBX5_9MICC|nr:hypothetical protein [Arthrobacter sulfonylureivorans]UNK45811.1 hypothetical protein MNQ99_18165 [Arthrobacter sulfonylureivorans]